MAGRERVMCDECGAPDDECKARFEECLAKEFSDPRYGAVHHLTVATYMLQHPSQLTREGWLYERQLLRELLIDGKQPEQIRTQRGSLLDSGTRTFRIKSRTGERVIEHRQWEKTILDVRMEDAKQYRKDIHAWARATMQESENIAL